MNRTQTWIVTAAVATGAAVGAAGLAAAATNSTSTATAAPDSSSTTAPGQPGTAPRDPAAVDHGPGETLLTGTTAEKVRAAAQAAVPGGTIIRVETDSAGSPYEAHVRKLDGTEVTLKIDSSFKVTSTESDFGRGPGDGHR
jgi:hypothetical protein